MGTGAVPTIVSALSAGRRRTAAWPCESYPADGWRILVNAFVLGLPAQSPGVRCAATSTGPPGTVGNSRTSCRPCAARARVIRPVS